MIAGQKIKIEVGANRTSKLEVLNKMYCQCNYKSNIRSDCIYYYCEHDMGASIDCCTLRGLGDCPCTKDCPDYADKAEVYRLGLKALKQPEIIHCKDCRFLIDEGDGYMCGNSKGWVVGTDPEFGCVLAEDVNRLRNDPEAEWVEIVRCKNCKHRVEKPIGDGRYWCELHDAFMYYCSDAERRTDETD